MQKIRSKRIFYMKYKEYVQQKLLNIKTLLFISVFNKLREKKL